MCNYLILMEIRSRKRMGTGGPLPVAPAARSAAVHLDEPRKGGVANPQAAPETASQLVGPADGVATPERRAAVAR